MTRNNNLGSDFYVSWHAGRMLFFNNQSPYGEEAAQLNQLSIYKRLARPGEDQLGFAYPIYVLIPILPLIFLPYAIAQAIWIAFLILFLSTALFSVKNSTPAWLIPISCFYYPFIFGIILGNFAIFMAAFFIVILHHASSEKNLASSNQILLGIILAWSTAKPQLTWLYLVLVIFYALLHGWRTMIYTFLVSLSIMFLLSFLTRPTWLQEWLGEISRYAAYNHALPNLTRYLQAFMVEKTSVFLTCFFALLCLLLVIALLAGLKKGNNSHNLLFLWGRFTAFLFHPTVHSYEQVTFLIPFFIILLSGKKSQKTMLIWSVGMIAGWIGFVLSFSYQHTIVDALPFLIYSLWVLCQIIEVKRKNASPSFNSLIQRADF